MAEKIKRAKEDIGRYHQKMDKLWRIDRDTYSLLQGEEYEGDRDVSLQIIFNTLSFA